MPPFWLNIFSIALAIAVSNGSGVEVYAVIPSSTVPAFAVQLDMDGIVLPNGHGLRATTSKSESFVVTAFGSDLT